MQTRHGFVVSLSIIIGAAFLFIGLPNTATAAETHFNTQSYENTETATHHAVPVRGGHGGGGHGGGFSSGGSHGGGFFGGGHSDEGGTHDNSHKNSHEDENSKKRNGTGNGGGTSGYNGGSSSSCNPNDRNCTKQQHRGFFSQVGDFLRTNALASTIGIAFIIYAIYAFFKQRKPASKEQDTNAQ